MKAKHTKGPWKAKRWEKIIYDVESILLKKISSFIESSWSDLRTDDILQALENRDIDPYAVSETILATYFPQLGRGIER